MASEPGQGTGGGREKPRPARGWSWIKAATILAGTVFAALQVIPGPAKTNPPVVPSRTLEANSRMTGEVSALLRRACMDCHSNETRWPWYSRIAPLSWHIAEDVNSARQAMNFSEWSTGAGRMPATAVGALAAACANVRSGRMPLARYAMLHPEARLSAQDQAALCQWTGIEMARLLAEKRKAVSLEAHNESRPGGD